MMPEDNDKSTLDTTPVEQSSPEVTPSPAPETNSLYGDQPSIGSQAATPTPAGAPVAAPAPINPTNGLAIAALIVGIVAFISGWIAFWGILVGATAIVLGVLALKKPGNKAMSIIGIVGGGLAALVSLATTTIFIIALVAGTAAVGEAASQYEEVQKEQQSYVDGKKDFAKGETAKFGEMSIKANSVTRNFVSSSQYNVPGEGKEFILVNVTVTNDSKNAAYFSDFNLSLNDNGVANTPAFIMGVPEEFDGGEIQPGASVTGNIGYEVTKDAKDLKIQYTMTVIGGANSGDKLTYTLAI